MCGKCLSLWNPNVCYVGLGSASQNAAAFGLSSVIRPLQYYLLSLSQDCSFYFHKGASVSQCRELWVSFGEKALLTHYDPSNFVFFEKREFV